MNQEQQTLSIVQRYLAKQLSPQEEKELLSRMEADEHFAEEVNLHVRTQHAVNLYGEEQLKSQLNQLGRELYESQDYPKPTNWYFYSGIAAAFLILCVAVVLFMQFNGTDKYEELYTDYYTQPSIPQMRAESPAEQSAYQELTQLFEEGKYKQLLAKTDEIIKDFPQQTNNMYFVQGMVYLELDEPNKAIKAFDQLPLGDRYKNTSDWYQALAYLRMNKPDKSKALLLQILEAPNHPYSDSAQNLIQRL